MTHSREPLVSILIPAYNSEKWIAETIQSALGQTWRKKELIIVDDGSKDGTLAVAKQFASREVQIVSQVNQGAAAARNKAYTLCQGEYIQWLDADDLLDSEKIRLQLLELDNCSRRTLLSSGWGYFFHRYWKAKFEPSALWCDLSPSEWMMRQMEQNLHMQTATWLVSRDLTDTAGFWDPRMLSDDDGEYFCRVMLGSDGIRFVPGAKTYYRRAGATSLSHIGSSDAKKDALYLAMQLHIKYLLSMEDHEKSRAACRTYLQNWVVHFHPDRPDIVGRLRQLAAELGGSLELPEFSWKYRWIQKTLGWRSARKAQVFLPKMKQDLIRSCDRALSYFG